MDSKQPFDVSITVTVTEVNADPSRAKADGDGDFGTISVVIMAALGGLLVIAVVVFVLLLQRKRPNVARATKKLSCPRARRLCKKCRCKLKCRCRKKQDSPFRVESLREKEALREEIEKSVAEYALKEKEKSRIENQGKNDSFFAGEEYKDFEDLNPNVDMGFQKFAMRPNPDFVVQVLSERIEDETIDNHGNETLMGVPKLGDNLAANLSQNPGAESQTSHRS